MSCAQRGRGRAGLAAALALCALAAGSGCERSSVVLSLGLDSEDRAAQAWLGQYPGPFEAVYACPNPDAPEVQPVAADGRARALQLLKEKWAVPLDPGLAFTLTGQSVPKLTAVQKSALEAEAAVGMAIAEADKLLGRDRSSDLDHVTATLNAAAAAVENARGAVVPKLAPYLVRGVSFSASEAPKVGTCGGEVNVASHVLGGSVPKMFRAPVVLWLVSPPTRARVTAAAAR